MEGKDPLKRKNVKFGVREADREGVLLLLTLLPNSVCKGRTRMVGRKEMPLSALSPSQQLNLSTLGFLCELSPLDKPTLPGFHASFLGTKFHFKRHWEANHGAAKTKAVCTPLLQELSFRGNVEAKKTNKSCSEKRGN